MNQRAFYYYFFSVLCTSRIISAAYAYAEQRPLIHYSKKEWIESSLKTALINKSTVQKGKETISKRAALSLDHATRIEILKSLYLISRIEKKREAELKELCAQIEQYKKSSLEDCIIGFDISLQRLTPALNFSIQLVFK